MQDAIKSADPSVATGNVPKLGDTSEGGPPGDVGKAISEGARGAEVGDCLACCIMCSRECLEPSDDPRQREERLQMQVMLAPCAMGGHLHQSLVLLAVSKSETYGVVERRCLTL